MEELINDYLNGVAIKQIAKKYSKSIGSIFYILDKNKIPKRGKIKHYHNPFITDSSERDYWLGWIFSDGNIFKGPKNSWVSLSCLDTDILVKFKEFCGDRAKLTFSHYTTPKSKQVKKIGKVTIHSKELVEFFENTYNVSSRKAHTLNPNVELNWDLLRGAFDGDGSFKKGVVITSCSIDWINKIKEFYDKFDIRYTCIKDSAYRLSVYNKKDLLKIYHYLYDNASIYLDRKKNDLARLAIK